MNLLPHIAERVLNAPLMIHPVKLQAIIAGLGPRLGLDWDAPPMPAAYTTASGQYTKGGYRVIDGIGVIDVIGILAHRGGLQADSSYVEGYETLAKRLNAAVTDPEIRAIVLNIDSPGGEVAGLFALAQQIRAAREIKPIHAVASDCATSAAYLIASAANSISVTESAQIGSIGVITCHVDLSGALDKAGVRMTPIFAGSHKADGHPYGPLPPHVATDLQQKVDYYYGLLIDGIAAGRRRLTPAQLRATEATIYIGANAVVSGLADRVESPDQLIARLGAETHSKAFSAQTPTHSLPENLPMADAPKAIPITPTVVLPHSAIVERCTAAGEPRLSLLLLKGQHTAEQVDARIDAAKAMRALAAAFGYPERADQYIQDGTDILVAGKALHLAAVERTDAAPVDALHRGGTVADRRDRLYAGLQQALSIRAGLEKDDAANEFRSMSLTEMARACLVQAGISSMPSSKMGIVAAAITHTTSDFPHLLQNTAERSVLRGYGETPETFEQWTSSGELNDFRPAARAGLGEFSDLDEVKEGAEFKHGTLVERSEQMQLATYGKLFTISRQAIINDDLSAFTTIPRRMGRAARRTIGDLVYAVLTSNPLMSDGVALFDAAHANLAAAGAALGITPLSAARTAMALQKESSAASARPLNIAAKYLIVPVSLVDMAHVLLESQYHPDVANKLNQRNPALSWNLTIISDARLDAKSSTAFYLAADESLYDTIEVAYLDGIKTPYLEQKEGWTVDGVEYKVRIDAAVKALDWRTMYKNPGA